MVCDYTRHHLLSATCSGQVVVEEAAAEAVASLVLRQWPSLAPRDPDHAKYIISKFSTYFTVQPSRAHACMIHPVYRVEYEVPLRRLSIDTYRYPVLRYPFETAELVPSCMIHRGAELSTDTYRYPVSI